MVNDLVFLLPFKRFQITLKDFHSGLWKGRYKAYNKTDSN